MSNGQPEFYSAFLESQQAAIDYESGLTGSIRALIPRSYEPIPEPVRKKLTRESKFVFDELPPRKDLLHGLSKVCTPIQRKQFEFFDTTLRNQQATLIRALETLREYHEITSDGEASFEECDSKYRELAGLLAGGTMLAGDGIARAHEELVAQLRAAAKVQTVAKGKVPLLTLDETRSLNDEISVANTLRKHLTPKPPNPKGNGTRRKKPRRRGNRNGTGRGTGNGNQGSGNGNQQGGRGGGNQNRGGGRGGRGDRGGSQNNY